MLKAVFVLSYLFVTLKESACYFMQGLSFGGWLLTEPSWMYDQFNAPAENDLVRQWRKDGGDDYAINTFKNHWSGYISNDDLDTIENFGITHVRLPVGYWIMEAPVNPDGSAIPGATMYDFGFSHEGFVTGGINYLEAMIRRLKARGIKAVVDMHAVPGAGSNCQSYSGLQIADVTQWMQVGESAVYKLANWVVQLQSNPTLSNVVESFLIVNEPGLAWSVEDRVQAFHKAVVPNVQKIFYDAKLSVHVNVNFIGANEAGMGDWMAQQETDGVFQANPQIYIDYHDYYNWDGSFTWSSLNSKICGSSATSKWSQYTSASPPQPVYIGEWSDASNLDSPLYTNISDPSIVEHLKQLHANQLSLFYTAKNVIGAFYWTIRMGSGWRPWPTTAFPNGYQVPKSSSKTSLTSYAYRVWNFLELIDNKIALPLAAYNITGQCECIGCNKF